MCSAWQLQPLVVGFLYLEGLIEGVDDLQLLRVCLEDRLAEVRLANGFPDVPPRKILTSGCTGGVSFGKYLDQIEQFRVEVDDVRVAPGRMYELLRALYDSSQLYRAAGGVHTSIFVEPGGVAPRFIAEDIGRHNTLDKLQGMALLEGVSTSGGVLLASGRISSEMLFKAAIMGVPIVGSRTSPTNLALAVADRLNITVCGYLRQGSMNVYTHPERVTTSDPYL
jgi:FdhD protein